MTDELIFFAGFIVINIGFLVLFPHYIILNAAVNKRISSNTLAAKAAYRDVRRYYIAFASCAVFVVFLFGFNLPIAALVLGFVFSSIFVVLDYKNIYGHADAEKNDRS